MKKVFLPMLLFTGVGAFAQTDSISNDILSTKKFRTGIFKTYAEFKNNLPTIEKGFSVTADTGKYDRYILHFDNGKRVRNVYAFSDGRDLFVNAKVYNQTNYFVKILLLGPITYFEDKRGKANMLIRGSYAVGGAIGGLIGGIIAESIASKNPGWILYLPDEDGEAYVLDKANLLSILKEANPDLLKRFKAENGNSKLEVLLQYVKEFNEQSLNKK